MHLAFSFSIAQGAILLAVWVLVVLGVLGMRWRQHRRHGVVFPEVSAGRIRFQESDASGCSHRNTSTRFGGAAWCLQVTVTDEEVWVRTEFPFNVLALQGDLEHRISRGSIVGVQRSDSGQSLLLDYRDDQGQPHRLTLRLRRPGDFLRALGLQSEIKAPPPPLSNHRQQADPVRMEGFLACVRCAWPAAVPVMAATMLGTSGDRQVLATLAVALVPVGFGFAAWRCFRGSHRYENIAIALILLNGAGVVVGLLGASLVRIWVHG